VSETRSLHRKLAQIMYEADRIPKNGRAPEAMGGYPFVQVGDAADYIRKALSEKVISMLPTAVRIIGQTDRPTKSGGTQTTVDIITDWTLTDGETGEYIIIQSFGAGADGGDKYSGKAQTNAMKYALLMGFLLSTGDDPEQGEDEHRPARASTTPPPRPTLVSVAPRAASVASGPDIDPGELESLVEGYTPPKPKVVYGETPDCPVHHTPMRKNSRGWFCPRKEGGKFCEATV
jgi:hypothetical protein